MKALYKQNFVAAFWSLIIVVFSSVVISAQNQNVTTPRSVSPAAEVKQKIGLSSVVVNYSRPRVTLNGNDRSGQIWGNLVPYGFTVLQGGNGGENPWRAGANENTTIYFSDDVMIEGKPLPAGKYGLHMAVFEDGRVTVIFSKNHTSWGSFFYQPEEDALRVDVRSKEIPHTEVLTYDFVDMGSNYGVLALSWEKKQIPIKIEVDLQKTVLANFRKELRGLPAFFWQGFQTAAQWCLNNNTNHEEALRWSEIAISRNRSYPTLATKGGLLFQTGKQAEGDKILDEAVELANKNQLNALGYQMMAQKRFDRAIEFLKLNIERFPDDPNGYDSLGEAYTQAGDRENAIKNLRKSLSMNPPPLVKANSEKLLKELGEKL
ncbi:MAG: DUF2911 domain-containing protein [Acidobacteria bacterium]|nr:MAG: DUF2911 domain-containing protein [Acidobacteriota bacterium]REJ99228.1 MAG: DUF2911 domain-containing protein [Acidobacteriota bacterium]REK16051.1 MAG: DUF2911 domain-containing protein [Acidobacteriota bacterium]REK43732.1 MAG: DUF2911 domain-containing protein [Acidobacteriota bacterium]